ncbi:MAG: hypothetical protein QNJ72_31885 [Pleurocapsa sp. MO_226.B13]|nr:hypothetical protein [Pleurocapsa sp. MO_226.B13]
MKIGYICNFKEGQSDPETTTVVALKEAGCQKIFSNTMQDIT